MDDGAQLRESLIDFAKKAVETADNCHTEEGAKLFLVLPFLSFLGYDDRDPNEVRPEHHADFTERHQNRVDFAVLRDGKPIIAVECKSVGTDLYQNRGQMKRYFNSVVSVRLAIISDGLIYEFFSDAENPNIMDDDPFLTFDLKQIARDSVDKRTLVDLDLMCKRNFDPSAIVDHARTRLLFEAMTDAVREVFRNPSKDVARFFLQQLGVKNVRTTSLGKYQAMLKAAFEDFLVRQVVSRLRGAVGDAAGNGDPDDTSDPEDGIITTDTELHVFDYVKQRLAFLLDTESDFQAIERIGYRDFRGKFVIFYVRERKGRILDFYEGTNGVHRFVFPDGIGEIETANLTELDQHLVRVFKARRAEA